MIRFSFILLIVLTLINPTPVLSQDVQPSNLEIQVHKIINLERERNGLNELFLHSGLISVARLHSDDMANNNYFSHTNLQNESPGDRVSKFGIVYQEVRENLFWAEGFSEDDIAKIAVDGWIRSEGHYQNMLSQTSFTGIGIAIKANQIYITQLFVRANLQDMQNKGVIFENDEIDELGTVKNNSSFDFFGLDFSVVFVFLLIIFVIFIGKDANKRNRRFYSSNRSKRR